MARSPYFIILVKLLKDLESPAMDQKHVRNVCHIAQ